MSGTDAKSRRSSSLVDTEWLAANIGQPDLRVLDCTVVMKKDEAGRWRQGSGRADYAAGHIPGALFVDLKAELSDPESPFGHMLPPPDAFAAVMSRLGVGDETLVAVYSSAVPWWATRLWWMLRAYGHDRVAVLDGGLGKWRHEGRPLTTEVTPVAAASFTPRYRPELVAAKDEVKAAIDEPGTAVVNALSPQLFRGESDLGYGRPGRIATSVNLSALTLVDQETGTYRVDEELAAAVEASVGTEAERTICYCGGAIAATMDAFVLHLLGHDDVAVYDGSLDEWAKDPELPMETG